MILPIDGASLSKRRCYRESAAFRQERILKPQRLRRMLFRPDIADTRADLLEALALNPVVALVSELRLELP